MKILLLAGEESGVIYANAIRERLSDHEVRGYSDWGFEISDLAVMGFWAVIRHIFYFLRVRRTMSRAIDEWRPDVVCTVDYPGMNLRLAAYAKSKGIKTVHVVCPQVWAWKAGRIPKIEASLDKLCCFFPFEPSYFTPGFAEFTGHPMVEMMDAATKPVVPSNPRTVAILPGSRLGEIDSCLPILLEAVKDFVGIKVEIPAANQKARQAIDEILKRYNINAVVTDGGARDLLRRADCAAIASGTATLEAALAGCPTVLVYRVGRLLAWFARRVIKGISHVGLANVIAEKSGTPCPMPELLQEDFTPMAVARQLKEWLENEEARQEAKAALARTMALLSGKGDAIGNIVRNLI